MRTTILAGLLALAIAMVPAVSAQTFHQTYEVGPTYAAWRCPTGFVTGTVAEETGIGEATCDPTGTAQDESLDIGGATFGPDDVDPDSTTVQASVVDDFWGAGVIGAYGCTDENDNNVCGETDQGETQEIFCGNSPVIEVGPPTDWQSVVIFVSYPRWSIENCDAQALTATTGGVVDPAGGIFATFA